VHDRLGDEAKEKVLNQSKRKSEIDPIVPQLQDFQSVAVEVHVTVEVHLVESFHRNGLLAIVRFLVLCLVEREVVLDRLAGELGLLVLPRSVLGCDDPERTKDWQVYNQRKENPCLEATAELPADVSRNESEQCKEGIVVEMVRGCPIGRQGSIWNGRILWGTKSQLAVSSIASSMAGGAMISR
jgi:hypothetical protein